MSCWMWPRVGVLQAPDSTSSLAFPAGLRDNDHSRTQGNGTEECSRRRRLGGYQVWMWNRLVCIFILVGKCRHAIHKLSNLPPVPKKKRRGNSPLD